MTSGVSTHYAGECRNCGGPVGFRNKTGYCSKSHECRTMSSAVRRQQSPKGKGRKHTGTLIPEVRDLDTNEIIIDEVAIHVALAGGRSVSLTETERRIVVRSLLLRGATANEIAMHLGVRVQTALTIIGEVNEPTPPRHAS